MRNLISPQEEHLSQIKWISERHHYRNLRMNPEIVQRWIKALRSGKYIKTIGKLRNHREVNCMSALGVLLDITKKETGGRWRGMWFELAPEKGDQYWVPSFAAKKLNIDSHGSFKRKCKLGKGFYSLTDLNDNSSYTLKMMADVVEENFLTK